MWKTSSVIDLNRGMVYNRGMTKATKKVTVKKASLLKKRTATNKDNALPLDESKTNAKQLTIKQKKFVSAKVSGDTNALAYQKAGYSVSTRATAEVNASRLLSKANIQRAIDEALEHHGATPEFAVGRLKQIAEQTSEVGAARLASKDILELHGWKRGETPTVSLEIANASFYGSTRGRE